MKRTGNSKPFWTRIAALVAMLSSEQDGEALNAARAIGRLLIAEGKSWADLTQRIEGDPPPWEEQPQGASQGGFSANADWAKREQSHRPDGPASGPRRRPSAWVQDKADVTTVVAAVRGGVAIDNWSREFVISVEEQVVLQGRTLTDRQREKLNEIMDKMSL